MALVEQTFAALLGLQPSASFQPTESTQRTALDAVLADIQFHVAGLASNSLEDLTEITARVSLDDTAVLASSDAAVAEEGLPARRRSGE